MASYVGPLNYLNQPLPLSDIPVYWNGTNAAGQTLAANPSGPSDLTDGNGQGTLIGGSYDTTFYVLDQGQILAQAGVVNTVHSWAPTFTMPDKVQVLYVYLDGHVAHGNSLDDLIIGDGYAQQLYAGTGNDVLVGGGGADTFIIAAGGGHDVIADFLPGYAHVELDGFSQFTSFTTLQSAMSQVGSDVLLTLTDTQSILFRNHQISEFTAQDFHLPISTANLTETFADDFNTFSSSPDGSSGTWRTTLSNGLRTNTTEASYDSDSSVGVHPFSDQNGVLSITLAPGSNPAGEPYNTGFISTENSFSQLYGYFEMRAELPAGKGLWSAFWMLPGDGSWPPELDAFEMIGNDPTTLYFSTHSQVSGSDASATVTAHVPDVSKAFHNYGVLWGPSEIDFYLDGNEVATLPTPAAMHKPLYLIANLAAGAPDSWPGQPDGTTSLPTQMQIDYIHAYAYPSTLASLAASLPSNALSTPAAAATTALQLLTPASASLSGLTAPVSGLSVSAGSGKSITVVATDGNGLLHSTATAGVTESGEGSLYLVLSGAVASVNSELATLTYSSLGAGSDKLTIFTSDGTGGFATASVAITLADGHTGTPGLSDYAFG